MTKFKNPEALKARLLAKIRKTADCWEWTGCKNSKGYGSIRVEGPVKLAHRVVYELYCAPIPEGIDLCHSCDNTICVNPSHMFLGTHAENMADKATKGRAPRLRGEANGMAKLSDSDAIAIRAAKGVLQRELATKYGVSQQLISNIRCGLRMSAEKVGRNKRYDGRRA